jgi:hypothetical protein
MTVNSAQFSSAALPRSAYKVAVIENMIVRQYLDGPEPAIFLTEVDVQVNGRSQSLSEWIYCPVGFLPIFLLTGTPRALAMSGSEAKMEAREFTFADSPFVPVAIGFFGLGTGYFIWGGQALFGSSKSNPDSNRTLGILGFWMPGFMQFLTGIYLVTGLIWFNVFGKAAPLYMAGLAFTAYGIHWFAMSFRRYIDSSAQPDGLMAIASLFLSILGVDVFRRAGDIPIMLIFVGLTLIYAIEIPTRLLSWNSGGRLVGLFQFITGIWLMYCTYALTVSLELGAKTWV